VDLPPDFLALRPFRRHPAVDGSGERVTVLVPKFTSRFARRWFVPLLARPDLRVHLDDVGSFVWRQCDGSASLREIGERVVARFGGDPEARRAEVARFVRRLAREESLAFHPPAGPAEESRGPDAGGPTV
jgi:Coenzyme PQQ synthesis protein D (PqqD)